MTPRRTIAHYRITAKIGQGGMGEVWRATDSKLGREVAIKVLPQALAQDPDRMARFTREAQVLASLNHPNIAAIYGVENCALIMELIPGPTLAERIAQGPLSVKEALAVARQIAEALEYAHEHGIIHRDLKPANIKITPEGRVKVLDFGLAKVQPGTESDATLTATSAGVIVGTAAYMSPEQAAGKPADARSDIFSFGLVLYEMLSGQRAFAEDTGISAMAAILHKEPRPLRELAPQLPADLDRVIGRCLAKSPTSRYATMAALRLALDTGEKPAAQPKETSIAVLPFTNLSADKENEYFSDGLAEEVLNALAQIPGLRVIARASAFAFRGREHAIAEIAGKLQVTTVLHGSMRRAGNRIRVTATLINASDEAQLWSERYDREMRDIFDIQDEIAQAIVDRLKVQLGAKAGEPLMKRYTQNVEAHSLYLKGNFHLYRFTREDMDKGRSCLEQAVALEPGYAPAWVQLADYYIAGAHLGLALPLDLWPKASEAAQKALDADPDLAEAQAVVGVLEAIRKYRWEAGLKLLEAAARLNSASARCYFWLGRVLFTLHRADEAIAALRRAVDLDPVSTLYREHLADIYLLDGRPEEAVEHARFALDVDPRYGIAAALLGEAYSLMGRHDEGVQFKEYGRQRQEGEFHAFGTMAWAYLRAGRRDDAERLLAQLQEESRVRYVVPTTIAMTAVALGDLETAFREIERAIQSADPNLQYVLYSTYFAPLRGDARYAEALRRLNLVS
jgi:TolB-like protein/Flp pilus assembly protein TadD